VNAGAGSNIAHTNAKAAGELMDALVSLGLRRVVVCPGSRSTPLVLAADAHARLEVELLHDERVAAFYALGLGREDGHATAMITTSGSAVAHALPAVVEADASDVPLLLLSADRPPELHDCAAPQTTRQSQLLASHTRYAADLGTPTPKQDMAWIATVAARAWSAAHGAAPGPVHLNLAFREPLWEPGAGESGAASKLTPRARAMRTISGRVRLTSGQLDALAKEIDEERTLLVCGPLTGADRPRELSAALDTLAARRGWPLLADLATGLRHRAPNEGVQAPVVATADLIARSLKARSVEALAPTQVLAFGLPPTSKALGQQLQRWNAKVITFDAAGRTRDPRHHTSLFVNADPSSVVQGLNERLEEIPAHELTRAWLHADDIAAQAAREELKEGLWAGVVAHTLMEALPAGSLLHLASSMPIRDADAFGTEGAKALHFAVSRGVNGIDGTLSTFAGEARAHHGQAALLMGDTALLHDVGGLLAVARQARPLTIVVVNNGGGGIFSHLPIAEHGAFERCFRAPHGTSIEALCSGASIQYRAVKTRQALLPSLERALQEDTTSLVEVTLDHETDLEHHEQAWAHVARALHAGNIGGQI